MTRRVSVRGIVLNEGKLLCVRLGPNPASGRTTNTDYWCLPGGGLDEGESLLDGVKREMIEETGIQPVVGNLLYIQQFTGSGKEHMSLFFQITNAQDYLNIDLSKTTHGQTEIAEIGFVDPAKTYILPEFLTQDDLQQMIDSNGPTRVVSKLHNEVQTMEERAK